MQAILFAADWKTFLKWKIWSFYSFAVDGFAVNFTIKPELLIMAYKAYIKDFQLYNKSMFSSFSWYIAGRCSGRMLDSGLLIYSWTILPCLSWIKGDHIYDWDLANRCHSQIGALKKQLCLFHTHSFPFSSSDEALGDGRAIKWNHFLKESRCTPETPAWTIWWPRNIFLLKTEVQRS